MLKSEQHGVYIMVITKLSHFRGFQYSNYLNIFVSNVSRRQIWPTPRLKSLCRATICSLPRLPAAPCRAPDPGVNVELLAVGRMEWRGAAVCLVVLLGSAQGGLGGPDQCARQCQQVYSLQTSQHEQVGHIAIATPPVVRAPGSVTFPPPPVHIRHCRAVSHG